MGTSARKFFTLHRFAILTAGVTFLLLVIGGLVHATDSGMACGNVWPACGTETHPVSGTWFPAMINGVQFEHTHRIVAGLVGILTLVLGIWTWIRTKSGMQPLSLRVAGIAAVVLVFFQAMLGRKTVIEGLPDWVSASHLATAMAFFSLLIWMVLRTRPQRVRDPQPYTSLFASAPLRALLVLNALAVYAQIVMGAVVRHTDAGTACMGFPLCEGTTWAATALQHIHMAHRAGAMLVAAFTIASMTWLIRAAARYPAFDATARAMIVLVFLQILLGVASVFTELTPWIVTAHLALGTLLLALSVGLAVLARESAPRLLVARKPVEARA